MNYEKSPPGTALGRASYGVAQALGLALQLGHGLLQVLHNELHVGPGGAAAHAEPESVPGHVEWDAAAQQHRGWPGGERTGLAVSGKGLSCAPKGTAPLLPANSLSRAAWTECPACSPPPFSAKHPSAGSSSMPPVPAPPGVLSCLQLLRSAAASPPALGARTQTASRSAQPECTVTHQRQGNCPDKCPPHRAR